MDMKVKWHVQSWLVELQFTKARSRGVEEMNNFKMKNTDFTQYVGCLIAT